MGEPAIEVHGLRKSFGAKEAVAGIDLEITAGSLAGLVGPNGPAKTTSLSMMTGQSRRHAAHRAIALLSADCTVGEAAETLGRETGKDMAVADLVTQLDLMGFLSRRARCMPMSWFDLRAASQCRRHRRNSPTFWTMARPLRTRSFRATHRRSR